MTCSRFSLGVAGGLFTVILASHGVTSVQAQARKLEISFNNGLVTILAENVTVRDILAEWGKKGGSRFVNAEKLGGKVEPYIEFRDRPEVEVLRSLLSEAPGYGAAPRIAPTPTSSTIDAVFILATRTVAVSNAPMMQTPTFQPVQQGPRQIFSPENGQPPPFPTPAPQPVDGSVDAQIPPAPRIDGALPPSAPPGPQPNNSNLRVGPGGTVTSTIPGVVIPPPATTGRGGGGGGGGGGLR